MVARFVLCFITATAAVSHNDCEIAFGTFSDESISQLSVVDLDIAWLRTVPRYRHACANAVWDWDAVGKRLEMRRRAIGLASHPHTLLAPKSVWREIDSVILASPSGVIGARGRAA